MRFFRATPRVVPAQSTEAAVLADLYRRAWAGCERWLSPRLVADQVPSVAEIHAWLRGGFEVYRVRHEGQLIGAIRCSFPTSACHVDQLAVDPDLRGHGVGHLLVEHAVGRARRAGVTRVWVQVSPKLQTALALYRDVGFRETCRVTAAYWDEPLVLLELPL
jgi:ribosomal protein S18 acetylase RimI-like enzyme